MECRHCGCSHCPVTGTRETVVRFRGKARTIVKRYRKCRHCGLSFSTIESYESEDGKSVPEVPDLIIDKPAPPLADTFSSLGGVPVRPDPPKSMKVPVNPFVINSKKGDTDEPKSSDSAKKKGQ